MKITLEMIKTFELYGGDIDGWARIGGLKESKSGMNDGHFFLISEMTQDLLLIRRKLVSKEYETRALARIQDSCENAEVIEALSQIVQLNQSKT